jgi:hypothetical protein
VGESMLLTNIPSTTKNLLFTCIAGGLYDFLQLHTMQQLIK